MAIGFIILVFGLLIFLVFQGYFLYVKMQSYNVRDPAKTVLLTLIIGIPIAWGMFLSPIVGDSSIYILLAAIGIIALVSIMIPYTVSYHLAASSKNASSRTITIIDIIGLFASILGIISFFIDHPI